MQVEDWFKMTTNVHLRSIHLSCNIVRVSNNLKFSFQSYGEILFEILCMSNEDQLRVWKLKINNVFGKQHANRSWKIVMIMEKVTTHVNYVNIITFL